MLTKKRRAESGLAKKLNWAPHKACDRKCLLIKKDGIFGREGGYVEEKTITIL